MITNYAIIDHVGQVSNISDIYSRAFSEAIGFKKVYTLKKVCQAYSPNAKEVTNKMKWYQRYNRNPKKVFIVCAFVDNKVEFVADAWRDRNIEVEFITEDPEPTFGFAKTTRERRCAMIWGKALGWSFSAPLFRDRGTESIDMYTPRHDMTIENGSYGAKRFTKPESFTNAFRTIAPEEECKEFFKHYRWLYENNLLAESLEPDYKLCPTCGRPVRETADSCQWCDQEFEALEIESFWEDSYNDDPDWNYEPAKASNSKFENTWMEIINKDTTTASIATKNYKTYLADCMTRDSGKFYFPETNEVEAVNHNKMVLTPAPSTIEEVNPNFLSCDPDGDATIHQLYWKRILEAEDIDKEIVSRAVIKQELSSPYWSNPFDAMIAATPFIFQNSDEQE